MPPAAGAAAAAERARTDLHDDDARRPGTVWRWNADVEGRERERDRAAARVASADTSSLVSMAPPRARAPRGLGLGEETTRGAGMDGR